MSWRKTLLATGLGMLAGYLLKDQLSNQQNVTPEKALKSAKDAFKEQGPVSGSWIYMKPETIDKNGLNYTVYRGGVTRYIDGQNVQFEFFVDANTGAVIDVAKSA